MRLKDGAKRIFLNTKGYIGTTGELKKMLQYIEDSKAENAEGKELENIHRIVTEVKQAKERRERYMWAFERDRMMKEEGIEEGREEGLLLAKRILHMKKEGKTIEEIAEISNVTPEMVSEILS